MSGLVLFLLLTIGGIFVGALCCGIAEYGEGWVKGLYGLGVPLIIFGIFSFICLLGWLIVYPGTQSTYGELEGMRISIQSYNSIIKATREAYYTGTANIKLEGQHIDLGLENLKQSTNVSAAIEKVAGLYVDYNKAAGKYQARWRSWWWRLFMSKPPDNLQPIPTLESFFTPQIPK